MTKYKCEECGHMFEGDLSTMQCPSCGSANIQKAKSAIKGNMKWFLIGMAMFGIIGVVFAMLTPTKKLEATLSVNQGYVVIEVDGPSVSVLSKEYQVVIFDDQNNLHGEPFGFMHKKKTAMYSVQQLMEGRCYTFNIERKDGKPIQNLVWKTNHMYCVPIIPVKPEIDRIEIGIADHEALVWNKVKVIMKKSGNFTYTIGDKSQTSPEFNNIKPGSYTVIVKNDNGVSVSQPIVLRDIKKLSPPLSLAQIQDIFDKVSSGTMSATVAQDKLAEGNVNLTRTIQPDIRTLWGALMEASMGERFKVISFENDPNTNKIKSGSLNLSKK